MLVAELFEAMAIANVDISDAKKSGSNYVIKKEIDGLTYVIQFYPAMTFTALDAGAGRDNSWGVEFRISNLSTMDRIRKRDDSRDPESFKLQKFNKGVEYQLLPIVMGYIVDFLKTKKPDALMFGADRMEKSRISLYNKIIKRFASRLDALGYQLVDDLDKQDDFQAFVLIRKDLENDY